MSNEFAMNYKDLPIYLEIQRIECLGRCLTKQMKHNEMHVMLTVYMRIQDGVPVAGNV